MKTLGKFLLRGVLGSWAIFAFLLACEVGLVPENLRGEGLAFHWQIWLLAGIILFVIRDRVLEFQPRCRCCGSTEDIAPLSLVTSHELLCRRCLTWDPGTVPTHADDEYPEYADLVRALNK